MLRCADLVFSDGIEWTITNFRRRYCPIWFPMGHERAAPAMSCRSECCTFDAWGSFGQGIVGHRVRRLV